MMDLDNTALVNASVSAGHPLCVYGFAGSGKTRLINLAWQKKYPDQDIQNVGPVSVNLDDSIDAKSFVGTYRSSTKHAGRFEWSDGLLVEMIRKGRWLVIEDVDKLNSDILSILPRFGDTFFLVLDTNERVPIHPNFGLMGTVSIPPSSPNALKKVKRSLHNWLFLECVAPVNLLAISGSVCPTMPVHISKLIINAYLSVCTRNSGSSVPTERKIGLHDLFRAIIRIDRQLGDLGVVATNSSTFLTEQQRTRICMELFNVFGAHLSGSKDQLQVLETVQSELELVADAASLLALIPDYFENDTQVGFGESSPCRIEKLASPKQHSVFTLTSVHLQILSKIVASVSSQEAVLLVGDTGGGKTTTVQFLANRVGSPLYVYNFSDQTEGSDLVGGLKPVLDINQLVVECEKLLLDTQTTGGPSISSASAVLEYIKRKAGKRDFDAAVKAIEKTARKAISLCETASQGGGCAASSLDRWTTLLNQCTSAGKVFRFVEGPLVTAIRSGSWVLLDEINLAPGDVLRMLNTLIESKRLVIPETAEMVPVHPNFKLFAAMNPPHLGKGKKSLPDSLRSRFFEIYCPEIVLRSDLIQLVSQSIQQDLLPSVTAAVVPAIVDLYLSVKLNKGGVLSQLSTQEGVAPVFSLRTLTRSLEFAKRLLRSPMRNARGEGMAELVDGLKVSFASALDSRSEQVVNKLIDDVMGKILGKTDSGSGKNGASAGASTSVLHENGWTRIAGNWVMSGGSSLSSISNFIATESVLKNLKKLSICVAGKIGSSGRSPVLVEGPTGAGKTSIVTYLAQQTLHKLVRINNHEHTDLQDYFGQYVSDESGRLVFQEGPLVVAVRLGHWVLLDELNLAPSEVLEALNRLLDDNRELVIPETNETVKAHPDFMLFASQNPVTIDYAGRKSLSRAFRNRFIEIQVDELPSNELGLILQTKCQLAESTANRMLQVYVELSRLRRLESVLSGRDSAMVTVRDLLRWGHRQPTTREEIALEGYLVLVERLRADAQKRLVIAVLEEKIGVKNLPDIVQRFYATESDLVWNCAYLSSQALIRTPLLNRLLALISRAVGARESILLVGETGTGKTSAVQMVAALYGQSLRSINCHQHLDTADLVGSIVPLSNGVLGWRDGPLVEACRGSGSWILLDEINLADDSVVERLNSLLDVDCRGIALAEKPGEEVVIAGKDFRLLCTMNPGNDFGKKELSAALRNRFSEVYVEGLAYDEPSDEPGESETIVEVSGAPEIAMKFPNRESAESKKMEKTNNFSSEKSTTGYTLLRSLLDQIDSKVCPQSVPLLASFICRCMREFSDFATPRDAILWSQFVLRAGANWEADRIAEAAAHASAMVFLDGAEDGTKKLQFLKQLFLELFGTDCGTDLGTSSMWSILTGEWISHVSVEQDILRDHIVGPFDLMSMLGNPSSMTSTTGSFSLHCPTSKLNFCKLVRAMYVVRPVLLEGSPGAGKSSLVMALARLAGVNLVRINLSDQTELSDILGQNVPIAGALFEWRNGALLEAVANGDWVLLDELNLAPQPVLEGLNALLDHRAEVYVPCIDRLVKCGSGFRLFATQNEAAKGDGRKRLPKSFVSRFTRIVVSPLGVEDLEVAASSDQTTTPAFHQLSVSAVLRLSSCVPRLPSMWNLRDLARLSKCLAKTIGSTGSHFERFCEVAFLVLGSRFSRTSELATAWRLIAQGSADPSPTCLPDAARYVRTEGGAQLLASASVPDLLNCQSTAVSALLLGLSSGCHCIVTGSPGSGKRSSVYVAQQLLNHPHLSELRMHSQIDNGDLVGQFAQNIFTGSFEWKDAQLTQAVRNGHWMVLSNAHCCPPSILDRLNALLEDPGVLSIPEKGTAETIVPHPGFRLILLTEKPDLLSQAIRNRCVEVALESDRGVSKFDLLRVAQAVEDEMNEKPLQQLISVVERRSDVFSNVSEMGKIASLVRHGLEVASALQFVLNRDGEEILLSAGPATEEQVLLPPKTLNPFDRELSVVIGKPRRIPFCLWFLESFVGIADLERRIHTLGLPLVAEQVVGRIISCMGPTARRLFFINLLTRGSVDVHPSLHAQNRIPIVGRKKYFDFVDQFGVCWDSLVVANDFSPLIYSGAFRSQSIDLMLKLQTLLRTAFAQNKQTTIPVPVVIELAAAAIALRGSNDAEAERTEKKILRSTEALMDGLTESSEESIESAESCYSLFQTAEKLLRLLDVSEIHSLVGCGVRVNQVDLVLHGLAETRKWNLTRPDYLVGLDREVWFAKTVNKIQIIEGSLIAQVHALLRDRASATCGDLVRLKNVLKESGKRMGDLIKQVCEKELDQEFDQEFDKKIEISTENHINDLVSLYSAILDYPALHREYDLHGERAVAVADMDREIGELDIEFKEKSYCREVTALGVGPGSTLEWRHRLEHTISRISASGIFVRPTNCEIVFLTLRGMYVQLVAEVRSRVDSVGGLDRIAENPSILAVIVNSVASFVHTVMTRDEFALFPDLVRPLCYLLMRFVVALREGLKVWSKGRGFERISSIAPYSRSNLQEADALLEWVLVEKRMELNTHAKTVETVCRSISETVDKQFEKADPEDGTVLIQKDVEISLASLVESNDKARAEAAVKKLQKELFPDTVTSFMSKLGPKAAEWADEDMDDETFNVEDETAGPSLSLDHLAVCVSLLDDLGEGEGSMEWSRLGPFLTARAEKLGPLSVDSPELIALNRLRIQQAMEDMSEQLSRLEVVESDAEILPSEPTTLVHNKEVKLRLRDLARGKSISLNFYSSGGGAHAVQLLSVPLGNLLSALLQLQKSVAEIADHPDLVLAISVVRKSLSLPSSSSALCALQAAEYVYVTSQKLEQSIPSRYLVSSTVSSVCVPKLMTAIAQLRASEILSWKDLRVIKETQFAKSECGKWLAHIWKALFVDLNEQNTDREHLFDLLLNWLRSSGVGQFGFRLSLLAGIAQLLGETVAAHPERTAAHRVMSHCLHLAKTWEPIVDRQMAAHRTVLDKEVGTVMKEIQFRLGGRHYSSNMFRMDIKRSHLQLASALKRFEELVAEPVESVVGMASRDTSNKAEKESEEILSISSIISSIRSAPKDKSGKSIKNRILADFFDQVRSLLKSSLSVESLGPVEFGPRTVLEEIIFASASPSGELLGLCMQLARLPPLCQNDDVKPSVIADWRSLCAWGLKLLNRQNVLEERRARAQKICEFKNAADCMYSRSAVGLMQRALEIADEALLILSQWKCLTRGVDVSDEPRVSPLSVPPFLLSQIRDRFEEMYGSRSFLHNYLPQWLTTEAKAFFSQMKSLFALSTGRLDELMTDCDKVATELREVPATSLMEDLLVEDISTEDMSSEDNQVSLSITAGALSRELLEFTIFLHSEGLCTEKESAPQSGEGQSVEWTEGTGLGEGSGVNDKSDEIEDAGQFDSVRGEKQEKGEEEENTDHDKTHNGVDSNMDQAMEDVAAEAVEKTEQEESAPEEDDFDREEDSVDLDNGGQIDDMGCAEGEGEESGSVDLENQEQGAEDVRAAEKQGKDNKDTEDKDESREGMSDDGEEDQSDGDQSEERHEAAVESRPEETSDGEDNLDSGSSIDGASENGDVEENEKEQSADEKSVEALKDEEKSEEAEQESEAPSGEPKGEESQEESIDQESDQESEPKADNASADPKDEPNDKDSETRSGNSGDNSSNQPAGGQSSNEATSASFNPEGASTTRQAGKQKAAVEKTRPSGPSQPSPISADQAAVDQWLEGIREIVEQAREASDAKEAQGETGELDDNSDKAALAEGISKEPLPEQSPPGESKKPRKEREPLPQPETHMDTDVVMGTADDLKERTEDESEKTNEPKTETKNETKKEASKNIAVSDPTADVVMTDEVPAEATTPVPASPVVSDLAECELRASKLSHELSEKLLAVLEPTKRGRLEGFYKTGKRVSMRRVLSWIASDYRRDKFWLRRSRPSHREYEIVICLDNTLSMRNNNVGELSLVCVSALAQSLQLLEVGKIGVLSFGTDVREICPLGDAVGGGIHSVSELSHQFLFNEESSSSFSDAFPKVIHKCSEVFDNLSYSKKGSLAIVITDGRFDKDKCRPYLQELVAKGHVPVLIVMDSNKDESILAVTSVHFEEETQPNGQKRRKIIRKPFLSQTDCPFSFYAVVQEPQQLPLILADILRQWIEIGSK